MEPVLASAPAAPALSSHGKSFAHLYPFADHGVTVGGFRMHYVDEGKGHPVVMVHGNPTWSFYWRNLILALRGECRTIAPDHIGMGLSEKPGTRRDLGLSPATEKVKKCWAKS